MFTTNHHATTQTIIKVLAFVVYLILCVNALCMLWSLVLGRDKAAGAEQYCVLTKVVGTSEQMFVLLDAKGRQYTIPINDDTKNYQSFILLLDDNKTSNVNDDFVINVFPEVWVVDAGQ